MSLLEVWQTPGRRRKCFFVSVEASFYKVSSADRKLEESVSLVQSPPTHSCSPVIRPPECHFICAGSHSSLSAHMCLSLVHPRHKAERVTWTALCVRPCLSDLLAPCVHVCLPGYPTAPRLSSCSLSLLRLLLPEAPLLCKCRRSQSCCWAEPTRPKPAVKYWSSSQVK